jgi:phage antirepressor YoqD-like protein
MNELQVFQYNGKAVTFETGNGDMMINANEMAKVFDKQVSNFMQNQQTQDFIVVLESKLGFPCLEIKRGGNSPGTWFHRKLALKFAGWLNAEFELWMIDRVDEVLQHGVTALDPDKLLNDPDFVIRAMTALKVERQARMIAQHEYNKLVPKANAFDQAHSLEGTYSLDQAAKIIFGDVGRNKFIKILQEDGIFMKNKCEAYQRFYDEKLFSCKSVRLNTGNMYPQTFVTHKGLLQLIRKYGRYGSYADKELITV